MIKPKLAYEAYSRTDGCRVLVNRLRPRGLSKANAHVDLWAKEIATSDSLLWNMNRGQGRSGCGTMIRRSTGAPIQCSPSFAHSPPTCARIRSAISRFASSEFANECPLRVARKIPDNDQYSRRRKVSRARMIL